MLKFLSLRKEGQQIHPPFTPSLCCMSLTDQSQARPRSSMETQQAGCSSSCTGGDSPYRKKGGNLYHLSQETRHSPPNLQLFKKSYFKYWRASTGGRPLALPMVNPNLILSTILSTTRCVPTLFPPKRVVSFGRGIPCSAIWV